MQHIISFHNRSRYLEEDYIVSSSNIDAYLLVKDWPTRWGVLPYPKILGLCGPRSSGKTYLANIWKYKSRAVFISRPLNIDQLQKINTSCIIDDIDRNGWSEQDLLHIFNIMHESNQFVLLTTSTYPLVLNLPDITSRIGSILITSLHQPDDEMVKVILMKAFSERSLKVSMEIINYLASRLIREFSAINEMVELIDQYSLKHKRNITLPLLKGLLDKNMHIKS